jgi:hypothetical protein
LADCDCRSFSTQLGEFLYSGWSALSFPCGHSSVNVVLYSFRAFLIARDLHPAWRPVVALGAAILIFLIAFSRLYLGALWWASGWQHVPVRRIDLTGETNEPLSFQWAGGLKDLRDVLLARHGKTQKSMSD